MEAKHHILPPRVRRLIHEISYLKYNRAAIITTTAKRLVFIYPHLIADASLMLGQDDGRHALLLPLLLQ